MKTAIIVLCVLFLSSFMFAQDMVDNNDVVVPYMLKTNGIVVDGDLSEWVFAYPLAHNSISIPDSSRFRVELSANLPESDEDMSGNIYMMWNEEHLYFAAEVRDDFPGYTSDTQWASDCIEIYFTNWDIGSSIYPTEETGWLDDESTGQYGVQFNISFNALLDSSAIFAYGAFNLPIETPDTYMEYVIWPGEDGYTLEGQIAWADVVSPNTGNSLMPTNNTRVGCTWSMYDIDPGDEVDGGSNFDGWAYTPRGFAGWMGPGPGFQALDVLGQKRSVGWEDNAMFDFVSPFAKKVAPNRVPTTDGDLTDWNYAFPANHSLRSMPDSGRFPNELPGNIPWSDADMRGDIYLQHDNDNGMIYFAASVQDNFPGWLSDVVSWQGDFVEFYFTDWDMGDALLPEDTGWLNDEVTGDYGVQVSAGFDALRDSASIHAYGEFNVSIETPTTYMAYQIWPNEAGYNIEGQIDVLDLESPSTGNILEWDEGERVPMTWSLYDLDTTTTNESWDGAVYTPKGFAAWMGPGPGFQYMDIKSYSSIEMIDLERDGSVVVGIDTYEDTPQLPETFTMKQNYPNPFNPSTKIAFALGQSQNVSLNIYNSLGQLVHTVIDNKRLASGEYTWEVNMINQASGVYIARLSNGQETSQIKMLLVK